MKRHGTRDFKPKRKADRLKKELILSNDLKRPFNLFTETLGWARRTGDNLESSHKQSWRFYSLILFLLSSLMSAQVANAEASSKAQGSALESTLLSKEGEKVTLQKKVAQSKAKIKAKKVELPGIDPADEKADGIVKTARGTISARNNYGIAVETGVDAKGVTQEMWATLNTKTKLSGVRSFSEMQEGDTAELRYKEFADHSKRILLDVTLIQKKPKEEAIEPEKPEMPPVNAAKTEVAKW